LEAVPFISRFVKEQEVDEKQNRYLIDRQLKDKLPEWKEVFILQLLQEWRLYEKEGIPIPPQVKEKTTDYRNENDLVGQWISVACEEAENETLDDGITQRAPTPLNGLFQKFKTWAIDEQQLDSKTVPDKKKFKEELLNWQRRSQYGLSLGKPKSKGVNGTGNDPLINLKVVSE
jgi:phage/plasmid-associated DNA primase